MAAYESAVYLVCLGETSHRYVPAAVPLVFQVAVAVARYDCKSDHAPPGGWTQNSYCGLGQPVAEPVSPTEAPAVCGEAGLGACEAAAVGGIGGGGGVGLGETGASWLADGTDGVAERSKM